MKEQNTLTIRTKHNFALFYTPFINKMYVQKFFRMRVNQLGIQNICSDFLLKHIRQNLFWHVHLQFQINRHSSGEFTTCTGIIQYYSGNLRQSLDWRDQEFATVISSQYNYNKRRSKQSEKHKYFNNKKLGSCNLKITSLSLSI